MARELIGAGLLELLNSVKVLSESRIETDSGWLSRRFELTLLAFDRGIGPLLVHQTRRLHLDLRAIDQRRDSAACCIL